MYFHNLSWIRILRPVICLKTHIEFVQTQLLHRSAMASSSRGRGHHPPHLRGKDIGLFYARKQKLKTKQKEDKQRMVVHMTKQEEEDITNMLNMVRSKQYTQSSSERSSSHNYWKHITDFNDRSGYLWSQPVQRIPEADEDLYSNFVKKCKQPKYAEMLAYRKRLPSYKMRQEILKIIETNKVIVVTGETGCGKTTQVPQYILDLFIESKKGSLCRIACTQPRRISAISVAERVAQERCVPCGNGGDVGYQIRLENKLPREHGSILYCTTGILLQKLQLVPLSGPVGNAENQQHLPIARKQLGKTCNARQSKIIHGHPEQALWVLPSCMWSPGKYLDGFSHVIVDEVHEQDLQSDFLLINLKDILLKREDLKVILMSATLNAQEFASYFGGCPMIEIPGFTYPVEVFMLEDVIEMTGYKQPEDRQQHSLQKGPKWLKYTRGGKMAMQEQQLQQQKKEEYLKTLSDKYSSSTINTLMWWNEENLELELIMEMLKYINIHEKEGSVLVFLPGWQQISKLHRMITENVFFSPSRFRIIPLHSMMPTLSQREVFDRPPRGVQKIILATNIAETSITIDDIVYVIDGGKIKMKSLDPVTNIQLLQPEWVSLSNMKQRRGRAGRTQPGKCYHLFTRLKESELDAYQLPEMLRSSLEETILSIKLLKLGKAIPFLRKAMRPPDENTVHLSLHTLRQLNALTFDEELTPLGFHLARLPMDPHTGKMALMGAIFSCLDPILSVAASLSFKDAFVVPLGKEHLVEERKRELAGGIGGIQSDHLMFARVIEEWELAETQGYGRQYCYENFLSQSTLRMLANLKRQYAEYLKQMKFIAVGDPKHASYNLNSDNELLLKAIICAGLYPHVAKVHMKKAAANPKFKRTVKAIAEDGNKVSLHPKSVNAYEPCIRTGWLVYHLKIKSTAIYLHDTTAVTPYSLLFFGGHIQPGQLRGYETISVDDWIVFHCSHHKARLVMELRQELDSLLEHKIVNPGVSDWHSDSKEAAVLKCIVRLLTSEETLTAEDLNINPNQFRDDDDGNDDCGYPY